MSDTSPPEATREESNGSPPAPLAAASSEALGGEPARPEGGRPTFRLQKGARIGSGSAQGRVVCVRGGAGQPEDSYEVLVRWDAKTCPEWYLYATLKRLYDQGELHVLRQGKGSLLERLWSLRSARGD